MELELAGQCHMLGQCEGTVWALSRGKQASKKGVLLEGLDSRFLGERKVTDKVWVREKLPDRMSGAEPIRGGKEKSPARAPGENRLPLTSRALGSKFV